MSRPLHIKRDTVSTCFFDVHDMVIESAHTENVSDSKYLLRYVCALMFAEKPVEVDRGYKHQVNDNVQLIANSFLIPTTRIKSPSLTRHYFCDQQHVSIAVDASRIGCLNRLIGMIARSDGHGPTEPGCLHRLSFQ